MHFPASWDGSDFVHSSFLRITLTRDYECSKEVEGRRGTSKVAKGGTERKNRRWAAAAAAGDGDKGASIYYVRKNFGILDPLPPLVRSQG